MSNANLTEGKEYLTTEEVHKINGRERIYLYHFIGPRGTLTLDSRDPMFEIKKINIESTFRTQCDNDFTQHMADFYRKERESRNWFEKLFNL